MSSPNPTKITPSRLKEYATSHQPQKNLGTTRLEFSIQDLCGSDNTWTTSTVGGTCGWALA
jgi:hypothetical protein